MRQKITSGLGKFSYGELRRGDIFYQRWEQTSILLFKSRGGGMRCREANMGEEGAEEREIVILEERISR